METGLITPMVIAVAVLLLGAVIMGVEYFQRGIKCQGFSAGLSEPSNLEVKFI